MVWFYVLTTLAAMVLIYFLEVYPYRREEEITRIAREMVQDFNRLIDLANEEKDREKTALWLTLFAIGFLFLTLPREKALLLMRNALSERPDPGRMKRYVRWVEETPEVKAYMSRLGRLLWLYSPFLVARFMVKLHSWNIEELIASFRIPTGCPFSGWKFSPVLNWNSCGQTRMEVLR